MTFNFTSQNRLARSVTMKISGYYFSSLYRSLSSTALYLCVPNSLAQVCQLRGNGIGVSTARAQAERAADAEAIDQGLYLYIHLLSMVTLSSVIQL